MKERPTTNPKCCERIDPFWMFENQNKLMDALFQLNNIQNITWTPTDFSAAQKNPSRWEYIRLDDGEEVREEGLSHLQRTCKEALPHVEEWNFGVEAKDRGRGARDTTQIALSWKYYCSKDRKSTKSSTSRRTKKVACCRM